MKSSKREYMDEHEVAAMKVQEWFEKNAPPRIKRMVKMFQEDAVSRVFGG